MLPGHWIPLHAAAPGSASGKLSVADRVTSLSHWPIVCLLAREVARAIARASTLISAIFQEVVFGVFFAAFATRYSDAGLVWSSGR